MELLTVHVITPRPGPRPSMLRTLRTAGVAIAAGPEPGAVILAVADTVDEAIETCAPARRSRANRVIVVADRFSPGGVLRALRNGIGVMLRAADATPARLLAALHSARDGDGRLPYDVLVHALGGPGAAEPESPPTPVRTRDRSLPMRFPLTPRQTTVLALMAEGHDNATIARALSCSEHTVKNVIYELMSRLQVRNRAHAVACAVRTGLI